ncbi:MAG: hypothetical protein J3K34DRAFT_458129 [Monoraphidium minutum]|nr:MAG: hypothetical protein J3K34DRAFT_458129 [Monoraphidium minutum]
MVDALAVVAGNATALQAFQNGSLGLSFGGAGFLIWYYIGVIKVLQQLGIVDKSTPVAGISSGALTAGALCSGMDYDRLHKTVSDLTGVCRKKGCAGKMDKTIRDLLEDALPHDAAARCSGRFWAGVTVLDGGRPRSVMAGGAGEPFKDRSDLISTLAASAYIPIWSGSRLFTTWRGMETADGSLSAQQPCPPGTGYCLRVGSRSPDVPRPTLGDTFAAVARSLGGGAPSAAAVAKPALPDAAGAKATAGRMGQLLQRGLDIAPGLVMPTPFLDANAWTELGLIPCDPATCDWLYQMGQVDTRAWLDATGITAAAAQRRAAAEAGPAEARRMRAGRAGKADGTLGACRPFSGCTQASAAFGPALRKARGRRAGKLSRPPALRIAFDRDRSRHWSAGTRGAPAHPKPLNSDCFDPLLRRDKARGEAQARPLSEVHSQATREVEGLVFQMASGMAGLKKLVDALGTARDTVDHRRRISEANIKLQARAQITNCCTPPGADTAKAIKERLTALGHGKAEMPPAAQQKVRRLMQDFGAMLQDYKAAQKLAAEREATSLPRAPAAPGGGGGGGFGGGGGGGGREEELERQGLLQQQQVQEAAQLDNAMAYNEALIEERDHGIQEIQRQIGEVNEMFQDLAVLINDQGQQVITIDQQISTTAERTHEGARQLVAAERSQRAARNKCLILWLLSGVIVALILDQSPRADRGVMKNFTSFLVSAASAAAPPADQKGAHPAEYARAAAAVQGLWSRRGAAKGDAAARAERNPFFLHKPSDPLLSEEVDVLPAADFASLKAALTAHPLRHRPNGINDVTSGWSLLVTAPRGVDKLCGSEMFKARPGAPWGGGAVCPFFDRVKIPGGNAWLLNILNIKPGVPSEEEEDDEGAAGAHQDDGLAPFVADSPWPIYAHEVTVLYVQVPSDRVGGDFEIWPLGHVSEDLDADDTVLAVPVQENKARTAGGGGEGGRGGAPPPVLRCAGFQAIVRFRGDAVHRVRRHTSASGGERVSLVLEQYAIPEDVLRRLPDFYMLGQETHNRDLLPFVRSGQLPLDLSLRVLRANPAPAGAGAEGAAAAGHKPGGEEDGEFEDSDEF